MRHEILVLVWERLCSERPGRAAVGVQQGALQVGGMLRLLQPSGQHQRTGTALRLAHERGGRHVPGSGRRYGERRRLWPLAVGVVVAAVAPIVAFVVYFGADQFFGFLSLYVALH